MSDLVLLLNYYICPYTLSVTGEVNEKLKSKLQLGRNQLRQYIKNS